MDILLQVDVKFVRMLKRFIPMTELKKLHGVSHFLWVTTFVYY